VNVSAPRSVLELSVGTEAAAGIETANVPARTMKRPGTMKNFFIGNSLMKNNIATEVTAAYDSMGT